MATRNAAALKKLGDWMRRIDRSGSAVAKGQFTRAAGKRTMELIQEGFDRERSPTGRKWAPHAPGYAANTGPGAPGPGILNRTGSLRKSIRYRVTSAGEFSVSSPLRYAPYHQEGRRGPWQIRPRGGGTLRFEHWGQMRMAHSVQHPGIKARPFLPTAGRLPARYVREYQKIAQRTVFRHLLKGRRK